jgi:hypothetical protein
MVYDLLTRVDGPWVLHPFAVVIVHLHWKKDERHGPTGRVEIEIFDRCIGSR